MRKYELIYENIVNLRNNKYNDFFYRNYFTTRKNGTISVQTTATATTKTENGRDRRNGPNFRQKMGSFEKIHFPNF